MVTNLIAYINTIISFFLITGLTLLSIFVLYLFFLALVYFFTRKNIPIVPTQQLSRFVFIIPAHNEEMGITNTIQNILSATYPKNLFDVFVIADNCTDNTAERARNAGAECLERHDETLRGKGYALSFAFNNLMSKGYTAFVVIDADSIISKNFLSCLNARLNHGEQVVQAYDGMSNPDVSVLTYLFQVGNLIENKLFWEPKDKLNLPVLLRGNGMCFSAQILLKYPWDAFSIVEDTEYCLTLKKHNVRIHFAHEMGVYARQPETLQQAFAQRVRWSSGNATLTKGRAINLIATGIRHFDFASIDLGISLIVGSRPLLLVANTSLLAISFLVNSKLLVYWASSVLLTQMLYLGFGIALNGISRRKLMYLIFSPFYLVWLSMVSLLGVFGFRKNKWVRTTRP